MAFFGLLKSKEKKLVIKWEKDHLAMVELAGKIMTAYTGGKLVVAKNHIRELGSLASSHVMNEDIEFYKLMKHTQLDPSTITSIKDFQAGFKKVKLALLTFLAKYGKEDVPLTEEFFEEFSEIVGVLSERIEFEENNLYELLKVR